MKEYWQAIDWEYMRERVTEYYYLTRLHRPIGILLLLWPTGWALWIAAAGWPDWPVLLVFTLGVILMRSAGCVINDVADRKIDPQISRTRDRPIASGKVKPKEALMLFAAICLLAFLLVLSMNRLTIYLAFAAVALAAVYPFMKRYTHLPQVVLGMAFGWSIPMAFAAQMGEVPRVAWLLYVINVLWSVIYDTMYAMVDREDDIKAGVKSTAVLFADADRVIIGVLQALMLLALVLLGRQLELPGVYSIAVAVALGLSLYQQYLIRKREPSACFKAFLNNNWLGFAVFAGLFLSYY
ncbi:4-hydroxybenzoate polyprenyltransferase [hydrothermal vent metagenome]|uniref:4-hydroxybenzoate polyprenyltransferase n=1 Tax=hydrothermal vent metagenome TaxID=652676 RepID=A0A3B1APH0_9ZZZZ